ncbi:MAG TPA: alpha/beta fold hydrolase [Candidatus Limnocylindria bacterium]|nr:alpha/beta fold hydrolase [Candidatus Limnocylindria bacterium]
MTGPRTIRVRGSSVRVVEEGPEGGDPVLLVHGVGGWAENWRATMRALAARGYRAIAVDLPGFGESERLSMRYFEGDVPGYARFVVDVLDELGIRTAHLMGHSLGGAIAYLAAVCSPERFRSLVLVAPGGMGHDIAWSLRLASLPLLPRLLRGSREAARAGLASCFHDPRRIPPEMVAECDRYAMPSLDETIRVLRAGVTLRGIKRSLRKRWIARAGTYSGPALVVWGERDRVLSPRHLSQVAAHFPDAERRTIPDAGHLVMAEQPEAFAAAVIPFLDRARGASVPAAAAAHN